MSLLVWVMSRRAGRAWPVQSWSERCPWPCGWVVHSHRQGACGLGGEGGNLLVAVRGSPGWAACGTG